MKGKPDAAFQALRNGDNRYDGMFFVGVDSTRDYCVPGCTAYPPRPENVMFFATSAAAHAKGFRPCLHCHPELAPELATRPGLPDSVARALRVIQTGMPDGGDIASFCRMLGVDQQELGALFHHHIGASPAEVVQTRRFFWPRN
jgi:AraC family transcriptional regulator of adaptative response / DNA-3-methyladenine glycosylase II